MEIAVVGTGYVGLVAGVCFADAGHKVIGVDRDEKKIAKLLKGEVPIYEPGLEDIMKPALRSGRLSFTTSLAEALPRVRVVFVAVGTPELPDGSADMRPTMAVVDEISRLADGPKFVVLKSTVPVGTSKLVAAHFAANCKYPIEVVNNPEFLKEGAAVDDFLRPDRIVIGCSTDEGRKVMDELYSPFVKNGKPILFMDNASAELTKYAANAFLAIKISYINELARLADQVGADINRVRDGFTSDRRINPAFFYPGVGYGGSCFPKDVKALVQTGNQHGIRMRLTEAADEVNDSQRDHIFNLIQQHYKNLKGLRFAIWGLSFKPRTDDVREAPALDLIKRLREAGAQVAAFDPVATENAQAALGFKFETGAHNMDIVKNADGLVLMTEWNEFRSPDLHALKTQLRQAVVFDGRNIFDPAKMAAAGFTYYCFGRQMLTNRKA